MGMSVRAKYYLRSAVGAVLGAAVTAMAAYNLFYADFAFSRSIGREYIDVEYEAEPININTASVRELQKINGIGGERAKSIVAYREENGGFRSADELLNIKGIGEATLEKIIPQITL